jgi:hypothetical protein
VRGDHFQNTILCRCYANRSTKNFLGSNGIAATPGLPDASTDNLVSHFLAFHPKVQRVHKRTCEAKGENSVNNLTGGNSETGSPRHTMYRETH